MRGKGVSNKVALVIGAGALVFLALALFGKAGKVEEALATFNWRYLPWILGLSLGNYLIRFSRWHYFLKKVGIRLKLGRSLAVFMGGLTMSLTPVKLGEFLKSYLLWEGEGISIGVTAPVVFAERVTDAVAIILLCAAGAKVFHYKWEVGSVMAGVMAMLVVMIIFRKRWIARLCRRFAPASQGSDVSVAVEDLQGAVAEILRPKIVAVGSAIGVVAWFMECVGLYLVVQGFGGVAQVTLFAATFVYAFSTFAGAVALIPGGLGITEGGIAALLLEMGVSRPIAVSATILVRICTLWFGIGLGALFLLAGKKRTNKEAPQKFQ
jgi:uncharacterized protein (TIRG00374 family)